ncbi:hypothetical protein Tco_0642129 [Tanacetum coccineum]
MTVGFPFQSLLLPVTAWSESEVVLVYLLYLPHQISTNLHGLLHHHKFPLHKYHHPHLATSDSPTITKPPVHTLPTRPDAPPPLLNSSYFSPTPPKLSLTNCVHREVPQTPELILNLRMAIWSCTWSRITALFELWNGWLDVTLSGSLDYGFTDSWDGDHEFFSRLDDEAGLMETEAGMSRGWMDGAMFSRSRSCSMGGVISHTDHSLCNRWEEKEIKILQSADVRGRCVMSDVVRDRPRRRGWAGGGRREMERAGGGQRLHHNPADSSGQLEVLAPAEAAMEALEQCALAARLTLKLENGTDSHSLGVRGVGDLNDVARGYAHLPGFHECNTLYFKGPWGSG